MKKYKYIISVILSTIMLLAFLPIQVFAAVHDDTSEYFTSDYFDWKDLKVTTDNSGNLTGVSAAAWYNYGDASTIAGRDYGFYIVETSEDKVIRNGSRTNLPLATFDSLMEGVGTRINMGQADAERKWRSFSLSAEECVGMTKDKDYNIWFWTRQGDDTYNTYESLMGTMTAITINRYIKIGGSMSDDVADYRLDSTVNSMNIIGQKLSAVWKTYNGGTLNTTISNPDDLTESKYVYNLYFYYPNALEITNSTTDTNGSITVDKMAAQGDEVEVTVKPADRYQLKSLTVYKTGDESTQVSLTPGQNGTYTFTMPDYAVSVKAEFEKYKFTIEEILPDDFPTYDNAVPDDAWENDADSKIYIKDKNLIFGDVELTDALDSVVTKDGDNYKFTSGSYTLTFVMESGKLVKVITEGSENTKDNGEFIPPHTHTLVKVNGQAPTEEAAGWKDYFECSCGALFEDENGTIPIDNLAAWKAEGGAGYLAKLSAPDYEVIFKMGGHGTQVAPQTVKEGNKATEPTAPSEEGYSFDGWYTDSKFTSKFDFGSAITADTTLYAKWTSEITYAFEKNDILTWQLKSADNLNYVVHRSIDDSKTFSLFTGIQIDNQDVSADKYDAASGSLILNLKPSYLNTLTEGEHTLKVIFKDGMLSIRFVIKAEPTTPSPSPSPDGGLPKTGDSTSWTVVVGIVSIAGAVVLMEIASRKKREI